MKADILKKSILQWAIEGKLVPQLESEPAVKQIGEVPENAPFLVPEKWKWCNFGNVVTYGKCEQVQPQNIEEDAWILDLEDIESGTGNLLQKKKGISVQSNKSRFKKGDVLYSKLRPYLNKVIVADDDGYCTTEIVPISLSVAQTPLEAQYLKIYLMSPYFVGYANQCSYGVKMPRLGTKDAKKALFPIPPIEEQRRIVAKLNELLPLVETYGKEQEALEKMEKEFPDKLRASLLQEAIQGKLVPQLESEPEVTQIGEAPEDVPFAIPEKWKWVRVSDVAHTNPKVTAQTSSTEVSFIPMAALSAGYISQIALDAKRSWGTVKNGYTKFIEGDVLLAKITPCFQNRKSAIAKKLSNGIGCGSSEFHVLRVNENIVTQEYLLMFLKSQWFITYGVENFKGTAGQQRLGTSDLKNCLFPLPPMSEQHRIVAKLNELLDSVKHLEYNVSKT